MATGSLRIINAESVGRQEMISQQEPMEEAFE
jgi:hypothetical protein